MNKKEEIYMAIFAKILFSAENFFNENEYSEEQKKCTGDFLKHLKYDLYDIKQVDELLKESGYGD